MSDTPRFGKFGEIEWTVKLTDAIEKDVSDPERVDSLWKRFARTDSHLAGQLLRAARQAKEEGLDAEQAAIREITLLLAYLSSGGEGQAEGVEEFLASLMHDSPEDPPTAA